MYPTFNLLSSLPIGSVLTVLGYSTDDVLVWQGFSDEGEFGTVANVIENGNPVQYDPDFITGHCWKITYAESAKPTTEPEYVILTKGLELHFTTKATAVITLLSIRQKNCPLFVSLHDADGFIMSTEEMRKAVEPARDEARRILCLFSEIN